MKIKDFPKWQPLFVSKKEQRFSINQKPFKNLCGNGNFPGIYLLAYSDKNLEGKKVLAEDISYVGMSNAQGGVISRIKQFKNGIMKGVGHSAGNRFYKIQTKNRGYDKMLKPKSFFVSILSIECEVRKPLRTPEHLRIMGDVVRDEYYILAEIKESKDEPELNYK